ncbi:MAG: hypothetical protein ACREUL_06385 [Steroidobacteraceae bacterium]
MNSLSFSASVDERASGAGDLFRCVLWLLWQCIRVPAFLLLSILEPLVSLVLSALALLGMLTAFFWKFVGPPHFPFFLVLGVSLGFEFALVLYHALLRLLGAR